MIHAEAQLPGTMVDLHLDEAALRDVSVDPTGEVREKWMYTDLDLYQDRDLRDATEHVLGHILQDPDLEHHAEDMEAEAEDETILDEMATAEDEVRVTAVVAATTEAAVGAEDEVEEVDDDEPILAAISLTLVLYSAMALGSEWLSKRECLQL